MPDEISKHFSFCHMSLRGILVFTSKSVRWFQVTNPAGQNWFDNLVPNRLSLNSRGTCSFNEGRNRSVGRSNRAVTRSFCFGCPHLPSQFWVTIESLADLHAFGVFEDFARSLSVRPCLCEVQKPIGSWTERVGNANVIREISFHCILDQTYSHCSLKLTLIIVNFKVNFSDLAASIIIVKVNFSKTKILHFSQNFLARFARPTKIDFPLVSTF